jgi:hypothetical protein
LLGPIFQALKWPLILMAAFGVLSLMLAKKQGGGQGRRRKNARWQEPRMEHAPAAQPERVFRPVIKKPVDYGNARFCLKNKTLLSEREQGCYWRLVEHLSPDFIVLAQVGFSQILSTRGGTGEQNYALYGTMRQKVADFVICRQDLSVVAVIELDDSSHRGKEEQDKKRDAAVRQAGLLSFRLPNTPGNELVKNLADVLRRMYLGADSLSSSAGLSPAVRKHDETKMGGRFCPAGSGECHAGHGGGSAWPCRADVRAGYRHRATGAGKHARKSSGYHHRGAEKFTWRRCPYRLRGGRVHPRTPAQYRAVRLLHLLLLAHVSGRCSGSIPMISRWTRPLSACMATMPPMAACKRDAWAT